MATPACTHEQAGPAPAAGAPLPSLGALAVRPNGIMSAPTVAPVAPIAIPAAHTGAPDDSPSSSNSGNVSTEGARSRGGASSSNSSGTPAVVINIIDDPINAPLGVKVVHDSDDVQTPATAKADGSGSLRWLLSLGSRTGGSGRSPPPDATAAAPKPWSKGRLGAFTPAWWLRNKGRTCGIVSGVAVVVVMAALMLQLGIIGSQKSTLQLPVLRLALEQAAAAPGIPTVSRGPPAHATDALTALLLMYDPGQGLFSGMGWWNQANALEAIIDYAMLTNSGDFNALLANTFAKTGELRYLGNYYDDEGWWGITWAKAYTLTGRQDYRDVAVGIYQDMGNNGWQSGCGGGMLWRKGKGYRATISSGLYMMLAMLLHKSATSQAEKNGYVQAFRQTWKWLNSNGMVLSNGRLGDGVEGDCSQTVGQLYSYNQGVMMGALSRMSTATGDSRYLNSAYKIADAGISAITNSAGIITEDCNPNYSNVDGCQFKGVFVRYLYDLYTIRKNPKYKQLLLANAASAWNSRDKATNKIGVSWRGNYVPKGDAEGITQTAGLDLFNGALGIKLYG